MKILGPCEMEILFNPWIIPSINFSCNFVQGGQGFNKIIAERSFSPDSDLF